MDINTDNLRLGLLFRYNTTVDIYHCPADRSLVPGKTVPMTRSYSMSYPWMAGDPDVWGYKQIVYHERDILDPGPSRASVFIDECSETQNNCGIGILPRGTWKFWDWPASRHMNGCNFSFADGHVEHWKWLGSEVLTFKGFYYSVPTTDPDLPRLQATVGAF